MFTLPFKPEDAHNFLLVFVRVATFFAVFPVIGSPEIPQRIKAILSMVMSLVIYSVRHDTLQAGADLSLAQLTWMGMLEVFKGLIMGFFGRFSISAVNFGTQLMGQQMGFGMATMFDPQSQTQVSVIEKIYLMMIMMFFFQLDIHHDMLSLLAASFDASPFGMFKMGPEVLQMLGKQGMIFFVMSLKIAAPIIIAVTLSNLILGVVTRTAPQMNIYFSVGLFGNIVMGMAILIASMPFYGTLFTALLQDLERVLTAFFRVI